MPQSDCAAAETAAPCEPGLALGLGWVFAMPLTYWPWFFRPAGQLAVDVGVTLLVTESFEPDVDESFDPVELSDDVFDETGALDGTFECVSATPWAIARPPPAALAAVNAAAARAVLWAASSAANDAGFTKSSMAPGRSRGS